jgi:hypothetical protein
MGYTGFAGLEDCATDAYLQGFSFRCVSACASVLERIAGDMQQGEAGEVTDSAGRRWLGQVPGEPAGAFAATAGDPARGV